MSSCTRLVTGSLYSDLKICQKQLIGGRNGQNYGTLYGHFSRPAETDPYIQETQGNHELSPNSDENNPFNQTN